MNPDRLGPAEPGENDKEESDPVDMAEGVEGEAPFIPSCRVSAAPGHKPVHKLVAGKSGDDAGQHFGNGDKIGCLHGMNIGTSGQTIEDRVSLLLKR